eukprot:3412543-Amphidinium_carterae.1
MGTSIPLGFHVQRRSTACGSSSFDPFDHDHDPYGDENEHPVQKEEEQEEQKHEPSDDSEGTYATPHWTNETTTFEEDLTWEQEDLEEEA